MSEEYGGEDLAVDAGSGDGGSLFDSGGDTEGATVIKAPKGMDGQPLGDDIVMRLDDEDPEAEEFDPDSYAARLAAAEARAESLAQGKRAHYAELKEARATIRKMEERFGPMLQEFQEFQRQKAEAARAAKLNEGLPEFAADPEGYVNERLKRQLEATKQQEAEEYAQRQQAQVREIASHFQTAIETEVGVDPDFRAGFDALGRAAHATMIQNGIDPSTAMGPYLFGIMRQAQVNGQDPLQPIRDYTAQLRAWEQSQRQAPAPQAPKRPSTRPFAAPPSASRNTTGRQASAKDIAAMSDEDFLKWRTLDPSSDETMLHAMTSEWE